MKVEQCPVGVGAVEGEQCPGRRPEEVELAAAAAEAAAAVEPALWQRDPSRSP